MGAFEKANDLAILSGGRKPAWEEETAYTGAPSSTTSGVYLDNTLHALVAVTLRETAHRRTARLTITTADLTANYVVTIDGVAVTYDAAAGGAANAEDIIQGIAAAIVASGPASAIVTASAVDDDDDSTDDTVLLVGAAEADYTLDIAATGTGELAAVADPMSGALRAWIKGRSANAPAAWLLAYDAEYTITRRGFVERFDVGGLERLYVELYDLAGTGDGGDVTYAAKVEIGPCVIE
jgi:hypothetical protein